MNKFIILLVGLFLINIQLTAQPSVDANWNSTPVFIDNFTSVGPWDSNWKNPSDTWRAYLPYTVVHDTSERQVYRRESVLHTSLNNSLVLRADYAGGQIKPIISPPGITENPIDTFKFYHSGSVFTEDWGAGLFLYGYFEIKCKLPVNCGAFPAFWLWNESGNNYREIDVFEYSWNICDKQGILGSPRYFEGQIYYYNGSEPPDYKYGGHGYYVPTGTPDLTDWHIYGVEWSPKLVRWYFDNKEIGRYNGDNVPSLSMMMIINNAVDSYATPGRIPITTGYPADMVVDYVKVNKLKCACDSVKTIQNNTQLAAFDYKVYKSITIGGYGSTINITNSNTVFRATDAITINNSFDLPAGKTLELITHECPQ